MRSVSLPLAVTAPVERLAVACVFKRLIFTLILALASEASVNPFPATSLIIIWLNTCLASIFTALSVGAAKLIHAWGVTEVIITLGSEGSLVYVDDTFYEIPAYAPHEVVDATGCGDTYSAGYLYKRLQGATPTEAGKFAAAMCTIKLEHNGPFNRTIQDVERIMK